MNYEVINKTSGPGRHLRELSVGTIMKLKPELQERLDKINSNRSSLDKDFLKRNIKEWEKAVDLSRREVNLKWWQKVWTFIIKFFEDIKREREYQKKKI